jgi:hypothetical protein
VAAPPAAPLRVSDTPTPTPIPAPAPTTVPPRPTTPPPELTYDKSTGISTARARRKARQRNKNKASTPTSTVPTVNTPRAPPTLKTITARTPTHTHGTRANKRQSAHAATLLLPDPAPFYDHFALHGNAFNPDTGQLADYLELSHCSEGQLWIDSCKRTNSGASAVAMAPK